MTVQSILPACTRYQRSAYGQRSWFTTGSIQYIAAVTRPDIAYTRTLASHMASSATKHWLAVQHVLRYLQSTIDVVLTFNGSGNESVVDVYSDSDFANGVSLKSVSGMVLRM